MSNNLVKAVAQSIRSLRQERGLTQEDLADKAGLDRTYISGVERAVRNITLDSLEQIVNALGVDLPTFLMKVSAEINDLSNKHKGKH